MVVYDQCAECGGEFEYFTICGVCSRCDDHCKCGLSEEDAR